MADRRINKLPYSSLFDEIMEGFQDRLRYFFDKAYYSDRKHGLTVTQVEDDNALSDIARKQGTDKINFPFFGVRYQSVEESTGRYNNFLMRFEGITIKSSDGHFYQFNILPVKINLTINFVTNDQKDVRIFTQRWMDACKMHYMDFQVLLNDIPITIRVTGEPNITFPDLGLSNSDTGPLSTLETTASIEGYMGQVRDVKEIDQINVGVYQVYSQLELEQIASGKYEYKDVADTKIKLDTFVVNKDTLKDT